MKSGSHGPCAALCNIALFVGGLIGACLALRAVGPFPRIPQVHEKLAAYQAAEACDVGFFGTSKIFHGVVPELFDGLMKARGHHVRSFNFGVDGMGYPESGYFCEQALALSPNRLRWVFIETNGIRTTIPENHRGTRRLVYWHDARRTYEVCRAILGGKVRRSAPSDESASALIASHLGVFLRRTSNLAVFADLLHEKAFGPSQPRPQDYFDAKQRGYGPLEAVIGEQEAQQLQLDLAKFKKPRRPRDEVSDELLRQFGERCAQAGATVVYVISPNPNPSPQMFGQGMEGPPVFAFDLPAQFPALYDRAHRADYSHLNDAGARLFTEELAKRFAQHLSTLAGK